MIGQSRSSEVVTDRAFFVYYWTLGRATLRQDLPPILLSCSLNFQSKPLQ
jgi:hypothetical protein